MVGLTSSPPVLPLSPHWRSHARMHFPLWPLGWRKEGQGVIVLALPSICSISYACVLSLLLPATPARLRLPQRRNPAHYLTSQTPPPGTPLPLHSGGKGDYQNLAIRLGCSPGLHAWPPWATVHDLVVCVRDCGARTRVCPSRATWHVCA